MADAMDTLKGLLGDNAEDKIKSALSAFSENGADNAKGGTDGGMSAESMGYLMQMRDLMNKMTSNGNDPRARLLLSLRPYMSDSRKRSIDSTIKLLSLTKIAELFGTR